MKRGLFYCTAFVCLLTSCLDKDNLSAPIDNKEDKEPLDLSFDFSMKSTKKLTITALSADNVGKDQVPFYVYLENPYTEEGDHKVDILHVYKGETNRDGKINTKITVPNMATKLYIYTPFSSYGGMQTCDIKNEMAVTFTSIYGSEARSVKARSGEHIFVGERTAKSINSNTNVHSYYTFELNPSYSSFGMFSNGQSMDADIIEPGSTLIANEEKLAATYFPEKKTVDDDNYFGEDYCTDLVIEKPSMDLDGSFQGAHVWVTFIGDGGFSISNANVKNSLCYYTYTGTLKGSDAKNIHKTIIYPNTNVNILYNKASITIGSRIQLLYWNGTKYVDTFPEGVKIGWAMISNKGNSGLNHLNNIGNFRFSTPILNSEVGENPGCYANGISRWCEEGQMNIVGMENRQHLDPSSSNDMDYNDILFKVTSDPVIKPATEVPIVTEEDSKNITGTLAFEDNWPKKGDYDFNDFITGYTYSLVRNKGEHNVAKIRMTFVPRALGATYDSGFAIQLPIASDNVQEVTGGRLESTNGNAVIIVYENTRRDGFGGRGGYINTQKGSESMPGNTLTVNVSLKNKIDLNGFEKFNPFIYVGNRNHEIHLTDMTPTDKMEISLLGSEDDRSNTKQGIYYRTDNTHPWALDIPSAHNSNKSIWGYPSEGSVISKAYPDYINWTATEHTLNWLNNKNSEYIY